MQHCDTTNAYLYINLSDEKALVLGAKRLGFVFNTRTPQYITVEVVKNFSIKCSIYFAIRVKLSDLVLFTFAGFITVWKGREV